MRSFRKTFSASLSFLLRVNPVERPVPFAQRIAHSVRNEIRVNDKKDEKMTTCNLNFTGNLSKCCIPNATNLCDYVATSRGGSVPTPFLRPIAVKIERSALMPLPKTFNFGPVAFGYQNRALLPISSDYSVRRTRAYKLTAAPEPAKSPTTTFREIQKDVSSLSMKRVGRRKKSNDTIPREQEYFDVVAFAAAEEYNLETLRDDLNKQGIYDIVKLPDDALDALHIGAKHKVNEESREIFFFREGCVVFWNVKDEEQQTLLDFVRPHQNGSYDSLLMKEELEKLEFTFTENKTVFTGGEIHLRVSTSDEDKLVSQQLEMFAFSNALSLSVKLAIWEASLEKYVNSIEWVLQDLKDGKKIRMSEAGVLRKAGELFTLSHLINLSSDLLDTPDFYWDRDNLEKIYSKTYNHLNIARRTRIMNEKLGQCVELTELLRDHLKDKHHTRLELMIIFLIAVEVAFQVFHLIEKYYWSEERKTIEN